MVDAQTSAHANRLTNMSRSLRIRRIRRIMVSIAILLTVWRTYYTFVSWMMINCIKTRQYQLAQRYVKLGADINARDFKHPLFIRSRESSVSVNIEDAMDHCFRMFTHFGKPVYTGFRAPALNAIFEDIESQKVIEDRRFITVLLECGASVNASDDNGTTTLNLAVERDFVWSVETLIKHGADVNKSDNVGVTPLFNSRTKCITLLVRNGARVNDQDRYGYTPIISAAERGDDLAIVTLLHLGANPAHRARNGDNALLFAARWAKVASVRELIAAGANVNTVGKLNQTALMAAAASRDNATLDYLLPRVANINSQDAIGQTAIMKAITAHNLTNVKKLIRSGANLLIQDCRGNTAYDLAVANRDNAILSLLPRRSETFRRKL